MAKKKSSTAIQFSIGIFVLLLVANVLISLNKPVPKSFKEEVQEKIASRTDIEPRRRQQLIIQTAVTDWMSKNGGTPPANLSLLVPEYFDTVPIDPATKKSFSYRIVGSSYRVGEDGQKQKTPKQSGQGAVVAAAQVIEQNPEVLKLRNANAASFIYDPTDKRDPFAPFDFAPAIEMEGRTELERYSIGQLKLTAVLKGMGSPKAIVETTTGKGFTISIGTIMGQNGGEVVDIQDNKILILETSVDFTGAEKTETIELKLRVPGSADRAGIPRTRR